MTRLWAPIECSFLMRIKMRRLKYVLLLVQCSTKLVHRSEGLIVEPQDEAGAQSPVIEAVTSLLDAARKVSQLAPAEIQIWTYAWLALPMFKPFVI